MQKILRRSNVRTWHEKMGGELGLQKNLSILFLIQTCKSNLFFIYLLKQMILCLLHMVNTSFPTTYTIPFLFVTETLYMHLVTFLDKDVTWCMIMSVCFRQSYFNSPPSRASGRSHVLTKWWLGPLRLSKKSMYVTN